MPQSSFGGPWTEEKLDILEAYLDAYTTALKNQGQFELLCIDAFAGTGDIELRTTDSDAGGFLAGSAERALRVDDRPFDRLIFIEQDSDRCRQLERLRSSYSGRQVSVRNRDANEYLQGLDLPFNVRGVLFLDPFATQVEWSTIEHIASLKKLDTWILFPVSAVARILPTSRAPSEISPKWSARLTRIYGNESWQELYRRAPQLSLLGPPGQERTAGVAELTRIYRKRLARLFGNRFLQDTRPLKNSTQSVLFEFMFCVGHPKGSTLAKKIAAHILKKL